MKNVLIGVLMASTAILGFLLYQERQEPTLAEAVEVMMKTTKPEVDGLAKAISEELRAQKQAVTLEAD